MTKTQLIKQVLSLKDIELHEDDQEVWPAVIGKTILIINSLDNVYSLRAARISCVEVWLAGECGTKGIYISVHPKHTSIYTWQDKDDTDSFIKDATIKDIKTKLEELYEDTNYIV